jgi:hypothetical protein
VLALGAGAALSPPPPQAVSTATVPISSEMALSERKVWCFIRTP